MPVPDRLTRTAAACALSALVAACAGNPSSSAPKTATAGGDGAASTAAEDGTARARGQQPSRWSSRRVRLVAGPSGCPDDLQMTLTVGAGEVSGRAQIDGRASELTGQLDDNGLVRLRTPEGTRPAIVVDGALDAASNRGQLQVTTYRPPCALRVDVRRADSGR
jgi:hypothetical protein